MSNQNIQTVFQTELILIMDKSPIVFWVSNKQQNYQYQVKLHHIFQITSYYLYGYNILSTGRQYQSHWNGRKVANQRNFQTTNYDRARKEPLSKTNDWSEIETVDISQHNRNSCSNIIKPNVNADKHDEIASNRNLQATQNQINEMKVENKLNGSLNNLNRHSVPHLIEDQSYDVYESHDNNNTNKIQITLNCLDNININMDSFSDHFSRYKLSSTLSHSISINDELNEHDALPNLEAVSLNLFHHS